MQPMHWILENWLWLLGFWALVGIGFAGFLIFGQGGRQPRGGHDADDVGSGGGPSTRHGEHR